MAILRAYGLYDGAFPMVLTEYTIRPTRHLKWYFSGSGVGIATMATTQGVDFINGMLADPVIVIKEFGTAVCLSRSSQNGARLLFGLSERDGPNYLTNMARSLDVVHVLQMVVGSQDYGKPVLLFSESRPCRQHYRVESLGLLTIS
jgi:hypothetical protein